MARVKGSFQISSNYELGIGRPIDARQLVTKIADLTSEATWTKFSNTDGTSYNNAYKGMIVACAEDAGIYVLKDKTQLTSLENGWVKVGDNSGATGEATSVIFVASTADLPNVGTEGVLYIVGYKTSMYWDAANLKYCRISSDWQDIEIIRGGYAHFDKTRQSGDYIPK